METKPRPTDVEAMMEAIRARADYVGPVLEEILQASQARGNREPSI
jgi:hypothetical protein